MGYRLGVATTWKVEYDGHEDFNWGVSDVHDLFGEFDVCTSSSEEDVIYPSVFEIGKEEYETFLKNLKTACELLEKDPDREDWGDAVFEGGASPDAREVERSIGELGYKGEYMKLYESFRKYLDEAEPGSGWLHFMFI